MRNINDDNHVSHDETDFCCCCGGEFTDNDLFDLYKEQPVTTAGATVQVSAKDKMTICTDCEQDIHGEFGENYFDFTTDVLPVAKWDELAQFCKRSKLLAFTFSTAEQILTERDVRDFCTACNEFFGGGFHPDTPFEDYVVIRKDGQKVKGGERTFTAIEAAQLNKCIERCIAICERENKRKPIDIYAISLETMSKELKESLGMEEPDLAALNSERLHADIATFLHQLADEQLTAFEIKTKAARLENWLRESSKEVSK